MYNLINLLIKRTVDRIMSVFESTNKIDDVMEDAASRITTRITDNDVLRKLSANLSEEDIASHIDLQDLANYIDIRDLAGNIDAADIAAEVDLDDVVTHMDMAEIATNLDYDKLAGALDLDSVAAKAAQIVREDAVSPALEDGLSDSSLPERLLERAVQKLLDMAEQAAKNEEV
jgi:hypothetical protein